MFGVVKMKSSYQQSDSWSVDKLWTKWITFGRTPKGALEPTLVEPLTGLTEPASHELIEHRDGEVNDVVARRVAQPSLDQGVSNRTDLIGPLP